MYRTIFAFVCSFFIQLFTFSGTFYETRSHPIKLYADLYGMVIFLSGAQSFKTFMKYCKKVYQYALINHPTWSTVMHR